MGEVYADLAEGDWQRLSAGPGSKGERWYDWQCLCAAAEVAGLSRVGPPACDVPTLVRIAGSRWRIESAFEMAKQEVGLDEYEVRNVRGWDCHMILALWALALLSVVRAASLPPPNPQKKTAGPGSLTAFRQARGRAGG